MKITTVILTYLFISVAQAATPMPTPAQVTCAASADEKKLAGAERTRFIETCAKTLITADNARQCEASADTKQLASTERTRFVETCTQAKINASEQK